mmetsp:Transcript_5819/g.7032  ORF Transcript_5819/g.7032 Transcript_5819/m.7032 type:complete len:326 (+) Transcript_5819:319-1296(+)
MAIRSLISGVITVALIAMVNASSSTIELCAVPYSPSQHLLVTTGKNAKPTSKWIPAPNTVFRVTFEENFTSVTLSGELRERNSPASDTIIMDYTFFENHGVDTCFCADQTFLTEFNAGTEEKPLYFRVQQNCNFNNVYNPVLNPEGLDYCPFCETGQCGIARANGGPMPIWTEWQFYSAAEGTLSGDGMPIFRDAIAETFPVIDESILACDPNLRNQPSAQIFCTNYTDPNSGSGYGVNGKNQKCGMAVWFNCDEDLDALDSTTTVPPGFIKHEADINLNLVPCDEICDDFELYLSAAPEQPALEAECDALKDVLVANDCISLAF